MKLITIIWVNALLQVSEFALSKDDWWKFVMIVSNIFVDWYKCYGSGGESIKGIFQWGVNLHRILCLYYVHYYLFFSFV